MMKSMAMLLTLLSLTACVTGGSSAPVALHVEPARIPLKAYSADFQNELAKVFEALPQGSAGRVAIKDYGQLRRAVCAAEGYQQAVCLKMKGSP